MRVTCKAQVSGAVTAVKNVPSVVKKAARKGMNQATKRVLAEAKANVPEDTKALKKALGRKVKVYQQAVIGVIGARRDVKGKPRKYAREVRRGGRRRKLEMVVPANYLLLVERGTRPHAVGKGSSLSRGEKSQTGSTHPGTKARPFMLRSWLRSEDEAKRLVLAEVPLELARLKGGVS
jgi:hypothetical protein